MSTSIELSSPAAVAPSLPELDFDARDTPSHRDDSAQALPALQLAAATPLTMLDMNAPTTSSMSFRDTSNKCPTHDSMPHTPPQASSSVLRRSAALDASRSPPSDSSAATDDLGEMPTHERDVQTAPWRAPDRRSPTGVVTGDVLPIIAADAPALESSSAPSVPEQQLVKPSNWALEQAQGETQTAQRSMDSGEGVRSQDDSLGDKDDEPTIEDDDDLVAPSSASPTPSARSRAGATSPGAAPTFSRSSWFNPRADAAPASALGSPPTLSSSSSSAPGQHPHRQAVALGGLFSPANPFFDHGDDQDPSTTGVPSRGADETAAAAAVGDDEQPLAAVPAKTATTTTTTTPLSPPEFNNDASTGISTAQTRPSALDKYHVHPLHASITSTPSPSSFPSLQPARKRRFSAPRLHSIGSSTSNAHLFNSNFSPTSSPTASSSFGGAARSISMRGAASSNGATGAVGVAPGPHSASTTPTTRYLLTVIPPDHIPHDPPHPRTSQHCSGYGPPQHFKRGTLVPLYPTLSSQLAAIAREYGLPSTGGLVLYLLSTIDPFSATPTPLPGSAGFAGEGGPRIGEEAWSLLWGGLFEEEDDIAMLMAGQDTDDDYDDYAPPVPPIPLSHREFHTNSSFGDPTRRTIHSGPTERLASDEEAGTTHSEAGEVDLERTSYSSDAGEQDGSVYSGAGAGPNGRLPATSSNGIGSSTTGATSTRHSTSTTRSGASNGIGRGHPSSLISPGGGRRFSSAASMHRHGPPPQLASYGSHPNLRRDSRHSARSVNSRMYAPSGRAASLSTYSTASSNFGSAVVVGKVEFDIDRRKGGRSKWYESWIAGATPASSTAPTPAARSVEAEVPSQRRAGDESSRSSLGKPSLPPSTLASPSPAAFAFTDSSSSPILPEQGSVPESLVSSMPLPPREGESVYRAVAYEPILPPTRTSRLRPLELGGLGIAGGLGAFSAFKAIQHGKEGEDRDVVDDGNDKSGPEANPQDSLETRTAFASASSSNLSPSAASGCSLAAMAGHGDDDEEDGSEDDVTRAYEQREGDQDLGAEPSQDDKEYASAMPRDHSVASSLASSIQVKSLDEDTGDHAYMNLADEVSDDEATADAADHAHSYRALRDDEDEPSFEASALPADYDSEHDGPSRHTLESDASFASPMDPPAHRQATDSDQSDYAESEIDDTEPAAVSGVDPLGDVFPNDEQTWKTIDEDAPVEEQTTKDVVETTGLGLQDAQVAALASTAPEGVVESRPAEDEDLLPPQDDVADVTTMLKSGQEEHGRKSNLASPIHLDSSPSAPETTGRFADTPMYDHDDGDETKDSFDANAVADFSSPNDFSSTRVARVGQPSIDVRPPSTVHSSPEFVPNRKQRQGWADIPPVVDKSMSASSSMASLTSVEVDDATRDSTIGLMENLDDLERALADLSPSSSRTRGLTSPSLSAQQDLTPTGSPVRAMSADPAIDAVIPPLPESSTSADEAPAPSSAMEDAIVSTMPDVEAPKQSVPPAVSTPAPTLASRPMFRYGNSSGQSDSAPRAVVPPRKASLGAELATHDRSVTEEEEELLPPSPGLLNPVHGSPISRPSNEQMPYSPQQGGRFVTSDPTRTPRSTSLSRAAEPSPRQIPLPPSPMPQPYGAYDEPAQSGYVPSTPASPPKSGAFFNHRPPPPPPVPAPAPEASNSAASETESLPSRSPRSSVKSIRSSKPWGGAKEPKSASLAKSSSSEASEPSEQGGKSPTFFNKSAFSKLNGFFGKNNKSAPENTSEPAIPSAGSVAEPVEQLPRSNPNLTPSVPQPTEPSPAASQPISSGFVSPAPDIAAMRAELFSTSPRPGPEVKSPRIVEHPPSLYDAPPPEHTDEAISSPRLAADADSLRPSVPAFGLASSLRPARSVDSFHTAQSTSSDATVAPSTMTVLPPLPFDSQVSIHSPISDYAPGTPGRDAPSPVQYPASAPATPAAWKDAQAKPRPNAATRFSRPRPRHRLSADIDQLLSQMNEIDFGDEESTPNGGGSEDNANSSSAGSMDKNSMRAHDHLATALVPEGLSPIQEPTVEVEQPTTPQMERVPVMPPLPDIATAVPGSRTTVALSSLGGLMTMNSP